MYDSQWENDLKNCIYIFDGYKGIYTRARELS